MEKGRWKIGNGRRKSYKRGKDLFFFFFFFCFSLLKTTEICFGRTFSTGKNTSRREKNPRKMALPPQKNMPVTPLVSHVKWY